MLESFQIFTFNKLLDISWSLVSLNETFFGLY